MIALESLNKTNSALAAAQKQVSTGYRVADSTDDGAAYAIAQSVRSTVGALTSANQQLGNVQGLLSTTQSGLNNISNTMASMRDVLVKLSDSSVAGLTDQLHRTVQLAAGQREDVRPGRQLQRQNADRQHYWRQRHILARRSRAQRKRRIVRHCDFQWFSAVRLDRIHIHAARRCRHRGGTDRHGDGSHVHQQDQRGRIPN